MTFKFIKGAAIKTAPLFLLICCGCFATSKHVDKTEKMNFEFFKYLSIEKPELKPIVAEYKAHISEGSGVKIEIEPTVLGAGLDLVFPGLGGLATLAMSLYARKKHLESKHVTQVAVRAAKEVDPVKALEMLSNDPQVTNYNG
jgi:hypothetical protein